MKVTLIANISVNGRVLLSDHPHYQLPPEAMNFYLEFAKQAGNLVIGFKTFENFQNFPKETKALFEGIEIVVLSNVVATTEDYKIVNSPEEAIDYMKAKGLHEIAIGGGTGTFNAFIDKDLVTDVYLNINPIITGTGGILVNSNELNANFQFKEYAYKDGFIRQHLTRS
ncbi:dihydrofolate reductase family protein [Olivibacter domesticus]|uniref:Dihydrofolate reductase n=1 Tax=Olivibacter domesticus TaxID=407022 RepID=A0A1H7Y4L0_OLID1|nr:dihydrofolate reductase [Olivibacter domesticus]SEM40814.1 Dihydrofolate reductase [Olivibacter domesticus]